MSEDRETYTPQQYQDYLRQQTTGAGKKTKYGNTHIKREGHTYDSISEHRYKGKLDMQVLAGEIASYDTHVVMPLIAEGGGLVGYYELDYLVYFHDGHQEWHDVKTPVGAKNLLFQWKARHAKAQYGVTIVLIDSKTMQPMQPTKKTRKKK
ncbi:DUF1064 domain-containing protein [Spirosoma sordidisoli]|uniref:DUF1064 domain-containing protein n=1 Tax=Spirosoma sordidisoli TaxID=2502893 RepID=A0A4Q2US41_9BACT|nr:hypothetical protein [Spirosoma sordidisoli]RYC69649.1 hypothetical protein EQG79_13695 [Spirosoma sordidisoli]